MSSGLISKHVGHNEYIRLQEKYEEEMMDPLQIIDASKPSPPAIMPMPFFNDPEFMDTIQVLFGENLKK